MATEILAVPEENLSEVIAVIRAGLKTVDVSSETRKQLVRWCAKELVYLHIKTG